VHCKNIEVTVSTHASISIYISTETPCSEAGGYATHDLAQLLSATALHAATHLSNTASMNNPMNVAAIGPALLGAQPENQSASPVGL
jgi:hypothetical protein